MLVVLLRDIEESAEIHSRSQSWVRSGTLLSSVRCLVRAIARGGLAISRGGLAIARAGLAWHRATCPGRGQSSSTETCTPQPSPVFIQSCHLLLRQFCKEQKHQIILEFLNHF